MLARFTVLVPLLALAVRPGAQEARLVAKLPACPGTEVELVGPAAGIDDLGFGASVALDGDHLLVGAPGYYDASPPVPGAIQVFERVNGSYSFLRRIVPGDSQADDSFGDHIVVRNGLLYAWSVTSVSVFDRDEGGPGQWGQIASLPHGGANFAVDPGGELVAIGGFTSVSLHERNLGGPNAFGVAAVVPAPASPPSFFFGLNLALNDDVLIVVAADDFIHTWWWFVFFFERDLGGPNAWGLSHWLPEGSQFGAGTLGRHLALQEDLLWVGDGFTNDLHTRGVGGSPWTFVDRMESCLDPECYVYRETGSVAARGRHVAHAVTIVDDYLLTSDDRVEVYRRTTSTTGTPGLALVGEARPSSPHSSFGAAIDVQGDQVVVGAPETNGQTGVVHVFELEDCFAAQAPAPALR